MNKGQKHSNLTAEEIKKYLSGEAMPNEMHQIEKKLLNDAFAADAVDGFEALKTDKIDEKVGVNDLKKRLNKRVQQGKNKQKTTKTIPLWQSISIAASLLLFISVGIYYFTYNTAVQRSDNQTIASTEPKKDATKPIEEKALPNNTEEALVMNEKVKDMSKMKNKVPSKILTDKEVYSEAAPPAQKESESADITKKVEENIAEVAPTPAQIEPETRKAVMAKPSAAMDKVDNHSQFSGQILDAENTPVIGASVIQKNANKATQTDINGNFRFNDLKVGDVLQISSIGYNSQELVVKSNDLGKIKLTEDTKSLSEVVTIGYGAEKAPSNKQLNQDPMPKIGWNDYDTYLTNSLKSINTVPSFQLKEPLRFRLTVEPDGKLSNVQIENNLSKEQTEKVVEVIEKGPQWLPARKKGKKVKKDVLRELKLK